MSLAKDAIPGPGRSRQGSSRCSIASGKAWAISGRAAARSPRTTPRESSVPFGLPPRLGPSSTASGHEGTGGQIAFADPERSITAAFLRSQLTTAPTYSAGLLESVVRRFVSSKRHASIANGKRGQ